MGWQAEPEPLEEDGLVFSRAADAPFPQLEPVAGRQNDIDQTNLRQLGEDLAWLLARPAAWHHRLRVFHTT